MADFTAQVARMSARMRARGGNALRVSDVKDRKAQAVVHTAKKK